MMKKRRREVDSPTEGGGTQVCLSSGGRLGDTNSDHALGGDKGRRLIIAGLDWGWEGRGGCCIPARHCWTETGQTVFLFYAEQEAHEGGFFRGESFGQKSKRKREGGRFVWVNERTIGSGEGSHTPDQEGVRWWISLSSGFAHRRDRLGGGGVVQGQSPKVCGELRPWRTKISFCQLLTWGVDELRGL